MTDVEFILREDARSKKSSGRGVYSRKCGSKSKSCSLPSDRLTEKQKKELSGEVKTYNLSVRLSYAEFKQLPPDLMTEYVNRLVRTYGANFSDIAQSMGITSETLRVFRDSHPGFPKFKPGGRSAWTKSTASEWAEFLKDKRYSNGAVRFVDVEEVQESPDETVPIPDENAYTQGETVSTPEVEEPAVAETVQADAITVTLTGTPQQIAEFISRITDPGFKYIAHIALNREVEQNG